jgi:hypothetical protein
MGDELVEARTALEVQIAEGKTSAWLYGATAFSALMLTVPWFPPVTAVMMPATVLAIRSSILSWRKLRESKRRRAAEGESP